MWLLSGLPIQVPSQPFTYTTRPQNVKNGRLGETNQEYHPSEKLVQPFPRTVLLTYSVRE